MKSSFYPPADKTTQWWEKDFDRGYFVKIEKILLHTTETTGWPSYNKSGTPGDSAPTLTYNVATRKWRQHNYLDTSARALGDPTSTPVRENRDNVIQIEIIWYAKNAASLPDTAYQDLAAFIAYVRKEWDGPSLNIANFVGSADAPNAHMSSAAYDAFNGILGHQHAPKPSTHWDPGAIDEKKLIDYVKKLEAVPVAPTPPNDQTKQAADITNPTVKQIWGWDGITSPSSVQLSQPGNEYWAPGSYLKWGFEQDLTILKRLDELTKKVDALTALLTPKPTE